MDSELALESIADVAGIVQDDDGNAWIPELGVPMGLMYPGKGYQIFTTVDTLVQFTYAPYQEPVSRMVTYNEKFKPSSFDYLETGLPFKIVISSALLDNVELDEGDEIAVFDGDLCVGATVWEGGCCEYHYSLGKRRAWNSWFCKRKPNDVQDLQAAIQCDRGC